MTIRCILAVDPGLTTGYAWHRLGDPKPVIVDETDFHTFLTFAEDRLRAAQTECLIVCESYTITIQTIRYSRQPTALETIGALKYLAGKYQATMLLQAPSLAKNLVPNDRLKALGWYTPGKDHGRDATRHLATWMAAEGHLVLPASPTPVAPY